jgi:restriction system protein
MKARKEPPILVASDTTLEEWLTAIRSRDSGRKYVMPDYAFPTDAHRDEYLASITKRDEKDIRDLIRRFLVPAGHLGVDTQLREALLERGDPFLEAETVEFFRRLLSLRGTWEGMTWVLDLLPNKPRLAMSVVDAFLTAHNRFLPDGRVNGLLDVLAILRTRYLERVNPRETLLELDARRGRLP